jgi:hypothetical protein
MAGWHRPALVDLWRMADSGALTHPQHDNFFYHQSGPKWCSPGSAGKRLAMLPAMRKTARERGAPHGVIPGVTTSSCDQARFRIASSHGIAAE